MTNISVKIITILIMVVCTGCQLMESEPQIVTRNDTLMIRDTLFSLDTLFIADTIYTLDTLFYPDTLIIIDTLIVADTIIVEGPYPTAFITQRFLNQTNNQPVTDILARIDTEFESKYGFTDALGEMYVELRIRPAGSTPVQLIVSNQGFGTLDTTILIDETNQPPWFGGPFPSDIYLYEKVNYIPINVGNRWTYEVQEFAGGGDFSSFTKLTDTWEVTQVSPQRNIVEMEVTYVGTTRSQYMGNPHSMTPIPLDTAQYQLIFDDDKLQIFKPSCSDEDQSGLGRLSRWQCSNAEGLITTFYANMGDTLSDLHEYFQCNHSIKYDLIKNIGIDSLEIEDSYEYDFMRFFLQEFQPAGE